MQHIPIFALLILSTLLTACASSDPLPRDLPSMRTIYDAHLNDESSVDARLQTARESISEHLSNGSAPLAGYTRNAYNEIENLFPQLPNPTLVMYIDPHLSEAGYPVPGYSTAFTLYEKPQFALPGEVPPSHWRAVESGASP